MKDKSLHIYRVNQFQAFIYLLFFLFIIIVLLSVIFRIFGHDEFEHIHSAWYLAGGSLPYADFFQVHHPLLWYTLAPVIIDLGETMTTVFIIRFLMAFLTLGSIYVVFRLTKLVSRSKEVGLIAALFLLSTVMYVEKGIQVRPDVPQVFFGLLSLYFYFFYFKRSATAANDVTKRYSSHKKLRLNKGFSLKNSLERVGQKGRDRPGYMCLSGFFVSLSFLFLQKSVFLLLVYAILIIYKLFRKELSLKATGLFLLSFLLPLSSLVVYLLLTGTFPEYILTNWLVPAQLLAHFSPFLTLPGMLAENTLLWFLAIASCCVLLNKSTLSNSSSASKREMRMIFFATIVLFIFACLMRRPFKQNFMLPMALFCIPAAYYFKVLCFKFRWNERKKSVALASVVLIPFIILTTMIFKTNRGQVEKIEFVLANTQETDLIYDGDSRFNLFRKDLHYFWYGLKNNKEFDTYCTITGKKDSCAGYDIYRLIREKKPKFISGTRLDFTEGGLDKYYQKTRFKNLYIRLED